MSPREYKGPILICGIKSIAEALGVSIQLAKIFVRTPGFPVWKVVPNGTWITTRSHLEIWADRQIKLKEPGLKHVGLFIDGSTETN